MATLLRINSPGVTHQNIDGEVIVLNLNNGSYFSMASTAASIWEWCDGATQDEIIETAKQSFEGDSAQIEREVAAFIVQLKQEELLVEQESDAPQMAKSETNPVEKVPFDSPKVDKYDELADLLLIDPIHDVDATGWPMPQP